MRYKFKYIHLLLPLFLLLATVNVKAQYPGGVSTGTTRGYKVDYYNGSFSDQTGFGAGTANAVPSRTGYTNKIGNDEFFGVDATNYGQEYSGIMEISVTGTYTLKLQILDRAWLYIDGALVVQAITPGSPTPGSQTVGVTLTAGDHILKVKTYHGPTNIASAALQISNGPTGSGITTATDVDGRFVRTENSKLTAWYKASDVTITANYGGPGVDKVNTWINKAPDYSGNGNMIDVIDNVSSKSTMINFNPAVNFYLTSRATAADTQNGLSYRGATKSMFMSLSYVSNISQDNTSLFGHGGGTNKFGASRGISLFKGGTNWSMMSVTDAGAGNTSPYVLNEPKLLGGFVDQELGAVAPSGTNPLSLNANGINGSIANAFSNVVLSINGGLAFGPNWMTSAGGNLIREANIPEAIYYPFKLSVLDEQKVNTYMAIKYGITLGHNYINTSGSTIFGLTTNAGYTNRIFGIGRELAVESLFQKQSQSRMRTTGFDFLVVSKGAIAVSNAANTGGNMTADNSYLLLGDNDGSFTPQATEFSPSLATTCQFNRIGREWKVQTTGTPGAVTFQAGSSTAGSFLFPGFASSSTVLIVDTDNDGDFSNATTVFRPSSVVNGVATFDNVTLASGNVITFGWAVTGPGGVSAGLKLWSKADDADLASGDVGQWNDLSPNLNHLTRSANGNVIKVENLFNYNPAVRFGSAHAANLSSNTSLGMNGDNTYSEFYILKGAGVGNLVYNEFITLGAGNTSNTSHRWENNSATFSSARYGVYGDGTPQNSGSGPLMAGQLGMYSNIANGTNAILSTNGTSIWNNATTAGLSLSGTFRIGTDVNTADGDTNWNTFFTPELIVYDNTITGTNLQKINSYLGIKYSIPLADGSGTNASDYLASDGTIIWSGNTTYKYGMFGIGRDDCSGLVQKQSKGYVEWTDNVAFGLTKLATTNQANTGTFVSNRQFIVVANDGGAFTETLTNLPSSYAATSCNAYRYVRNWKVKNTNNVTNSLQLAVGNTANPITGNWSNVTLAINSAGDATFATGTTTLVAASSVIGGVATFDNVTLPDGAIFTVCYTLGFPGGVNKPSAGISITTVSGTTTTNNVNGLAYKLYTTNGVAVRNLITTPFGSNAGDALVSTGYYHNATTFQSFVTPKISTNFGIELSGKLNVTTATATYQFRAVGPDVQFALIIDGTLQPLNVTSYLGGSNVTSGNVTLSAGYHDIIVKGGQSGSGSNFNLQWNGGSGSAFTAIPDANFFTNPQGPSAWYQADDTRLSAAYAEGATVATWGDVSGNGNTLSGSGNPAYYNTNKTYITNYNPSIYFTADYFGNTGNYITGFAYGKQGKSSFAVGSNSNSGVETIYTGYGLDATNNNFGLTKLPTGKLQLFGSSNLLNESGTFYGTAAVTTDILSGTYSNGNISGAGINAFLYANGLQRALASKPAWDTRFNDNLQLDVGTAPDYGSTYWYNKNLNEIIHYPWDLSATERQKVNSYLAIKWGTTLDQTVATNYLLSDGTAVWNSTTAGTFNNDITGIGRDDCGALNQKQSTSTDGNDIVSIGLGGVSTNNHDNVSTFANNKDFLTWAHNGLALTTTNSTNLPTSLASALCYVKMDRVWQSQATTGSNKLSVIMGKTGLYIFSSAKYKPVLLVSSSPTDFTGATIYSPTTTIDGLGTFDNVSFTGVQYFTIAYIIAGPGGVSSNLKVWFSAENASYKDLQGLVPTTATGDEIQRLNNMADNPVFTYVHQPNLTTPYKRPTLKSGSMSYSNVINFHYDPTGTGADTSFYTISNMVSPTNISSNDYRSATAMTSVLAYRLDPSVPFTQTSYIHDGSFWGQRVTAASGTRVGEPYVRWNSTTVNRTTGFNPYGEAYMFIQNTALASNQARIFTNMTSAGQGTSTTTNVDTGPFYLSYPNESTTPHSRDVYAGFDLGELIIYDVDKSTSGNELLRINSYVAGKFGYTMDPSVGSYISSNGTAYYNYANFWNRITVIGRDDCSAFDKRQSVSVDPGHLVHVSNDSVNGLAISNSDNPASFANNNIYLAFGDNNKSLTWNASENIKDASNTDLMRLNRVWRVKETGTVGTVYLQVPANTSTETAKLPAPVNSASDPIYLVVANTASGGVFNNPTIVSMIPKGDDWAVTYDFADGDYYTFATLESCLAPAGVTDGLTSWYKTTNLTTGTIATGTANAMVDQYGTNSLNRNASGTATVTAGTPVFYNYNRYVTLAGNAAFTKTNVTETALTDVSNGALYVAASGSGSLFGTSLSTTDKFFINNGGVYRNATGSGLTGTASGNIYQMGVTNGVITSRSNGTTIAGAIGTTPLLAGTTYTIGLGTYAAGTSFNNTNLAEAFAFNRDLAAYEKDKLDSYLAIKYGLTLPHNYYSPDYNGSNASTTTLYDVSTYGNRVFGLGNHKGGCFYQNQSSSSQQVALQYDSMLKISVDGILNTENSQNPLSWLEDQSYVMMGDNNGAIAWVTTNKPKIEASNTCLSRITRQWKVVSTKQNPNLLVTIADNSNTNHTAGAKLGAIPANNDVYMVISNQEDFTSVTANQEVIKMTLNTSSKEWEVMGSFDANTTRYITFVYKPVTCGLPCVPVNPATSRSRIK